MQITSSESEKVAYIYDWEMTQEAVPDTASVKGQHIAVTI